MKKDYVTVRVSNPIVFVEDIQEADGGLFIHYTNLLTNENYEHFQVMPGNIESGKAGTSKAETYLRKLARAADLDKDYLVLDYTTPQHHRSFNPIIGRVFKLTVHYKVAKEESVYYNKRRNYRSAEEIFHFENDGEFNLSYALHCLKRVDQPDSFKEIMLKRLYNKRKSYSRASSEEEFLNYYETL